MKNLLMSAVIILAMFAAIGFKHVEAVQFNEKLLRQVQLTDAGARDIPKIILREDPRDITIFGAPVATQAQMVQFIRLRNPNPKINCSVETRKARLKIFAQILHFVKRLKKRELGITAATLRPTKIITADSVQPAAA